MIISLFFHLSVHDGDPSLHLHVEVLLLHSGLKGGTELEWCDAIGKIYELFFLLSIFVSNIFPEKFQYIFVFKPWLCHLKASTILFTMSSSHSESLSASGSPTPLGKSQYNIHCHLHNHLHCLLHNHLHCHLPCFFNNHVNIIILIMMTMYHEIHNKTDLAEMGNLHSLCSSSSPIFFLPILIKLSRGFKNLQNLSSDFDLLIVN